MDQIKVFLDSDILISSILSQKGASFQVIHTSTITKVVSESVKLEVLEVANQLHISNFKQDMFTDMKVVDVSLTKHRIVENYFPYVLDQEDSHVVAAAVEAKVKFLLTYNTKHYKIQKIKNDFDLIVMKPGIFLHHLRNS